MKEVRFRGYRFLVPFLRNEKLKASESATEDDMRKLQDMVKNFTSAKTYAARQKILRDYVASIGVEDAGGEFYKAMFGMLLNLRSDVYNSHAL